MTSGIRDNLRAAMRLYAVTDRTWLNGRTLNGCVLQAIDGGVTFVQLREKNVPHVELVRLACELAPICRSADIPFVIDDDVQAAIESDADGVHVGQEDLACEQARRALGPDKIIGVSVQTVAQALKAQEDGADYLGVGALIPTATKPDAAEVSLEELQAICNAVDIPVVGIGGLNAQTVTRLSGTGVDGVAVVSAIFASEDCEVAARELIEVLEGVL